ncbi:MAG: hypothetical protein HOQ43_17765 [Glycomyces artemisiae]|nr:hypothetical protein [Glycomyces artemisiae]
MQAPQAPPQMLPPQTNYQPAPQPQPVYQQQPAKRPLTQEPAVLVTGAAVIILFVIFFVILSTII